MTNVHSKRREAFGLLFLSLVKLGCTIDEFRCWLSATVRRIVIYVGFTSSSGNSDAGRFERVSIKRIFELFEREFYDFEALKV